MRTIEGRAAIALIAVFCLVNARPVRAQNAPAPDPARVAAAHALLDAMHLDSAAYVKQLNLGNRMMKDVPNAEAMRGVMKEFQEKYMPYRSYRDASARAYANAYTVAELRDLTAFYRTPLGQKTARLTPEIMAEMATYMQGEMMKHMPELQQMMMQKMNN